MDANNNSCLQRAPGQTPLYSEKTGLYTSKQYFTALYSFTNKLVFTLFIVVSTWFRIYLTLAASDSYNSNYSLIQTWFEPIVA